MNTDNEFSTDKAVQGYLPLMHELALRLDLVAQACDGKLGLSPPFAREYAYLQFRRMCELIALGCLQLHGDLPYAKKKGTRKEWNAEKIMRLLQKNYAHSFPQCVKREVTSEGWNVQANSKLNALTFKEFKKLYSECGEVLHRGSIKTLQGSGDFNESDYQRVVDWQAKIVDLMNEHMVGRANIKGYYIISLRTESGYPECSTFDMLGNGGLNVSTQKMNVSDEVVHSYVANKKA
jgi:hypothetical protein